MNNWTNEEAKKALDTIRKKALTDESFFKLCLKDPKKAVKEIAGKDVPNNFKIKFIENKADEMIVVLPTPVKKNAQLSDDELEKVAGGGLLTGNVRPTAFCTEKCDK
jgi:hypothetical protein